MRKEQLEVEGTIRDDTIVIEGEEIISEVTMEKVGSPCSKPPRDMENVPMEVGSPGWRDGMGAARTEERTEERTTEKIIAEIGGVATEETGKHLTITIAYPLQVTLECPHYPMKYPGDRLEKLRLEKLRGHLGDCHLGDPVDWMFLRHFCADALDGEEIMICHLRKDPWRRCDISP